MSKRISSTKWGSLVGLLIRTAQLLAFPLTTDILTQNFKGTIQPVRWLSTISTPSRFLPFLPPTVYLATFWVAVAWVVVLMLLLVWSMHSFLQHSFAFLWPLHLLRLMSSLSTSVLFIPLLGMLLSPFQCGNIPSAADDGASYWSTHGYQCGDPLILGLQLLGSILAIALFLLGAAFAVTFIDTNPLSRQVVAQAHGRADLIFLTVSVLLVLLLDVFAYMISSAWVLIAALIVLAAVLFASTVYFLPFFEHWYNAAVAAAYGAFLFTSLCMVVNQAYAEADAALLIYIGIPLAAVTGSSIATYRAMHIVRTPANRLSSPFEVELKARFTLHTALWGHPLDKVHWGALLGQAEAERELKEQALRRQELLAHAAIDSNAAATAAMIASNSGGSGNPAIGGNGVTSGNASVMGGGGDIGTPLAIATAAMAAQAQAGGKIYAYNRNSAVVAPMPPGMMTMSSSKAYGLSPYEGSGQQGGGSPAVAAVEEEEGDYTSVRAVRRLIPPSVLAEVQEIYKAAEARMPQSAWVRVFHSRFFAMQGNRHLRFAQLLAAEKRKPPLDISFVIYQARKLSEEGGDGMAGGSGEGDGGAGATAEALPGMGSGAGGGMSHMDGGAGGGASHLSALNRIAYEKALADARKAVLKSSVKQSAFYTELADAKPDLSKLHELSTEMNAGIVAAESAFQTLFAINPQSLVIMRLYAAFCLHVTADGEKANALLAEADRIEDARTKDHRAGGPGGGGAIVIMGESSLDVFADSTAVINCGGTARNLGLILSSNAAASKLSGFSRLQLERRPVFSLLPQPLQDEHEAALRSYVSTGEGMLGTRIVFSQNKAGSIAPALLSVREAPPDDGPPTFIIMMRELRSVGDWILMHSDYTLSAASTGALSALGVDPAALSSGEVSIRDFCEEFDAVLPSLLMSATCNNAANLGGVAGGYAAANAAQKKVPRRYGSTVHNGGGGNGNGGGGSGANANAVTLRLCRQSTEALAATAAYAASAAAGQSFMSGQQGVLRGAGASSRFRLNANDPSHSQQQVPGGDDEDGSNSTNSDHVANGSQEESEGDDDDYDHVHRKGPRSSGRRVTHAALPSSQLHAHASRTPMSYRSSLRIGAMGGHHEPGQQLEEDERYCTWVRATMQRVFLPATGRTAFVLHCTTIPRSDTFALAKAEVTRRASMANLQAISITGLQTGSTNGPASALASGPPSVFSAPTSASIAGYGSSSAAAAAAKAYSKRAMINSAAVVSPTRSSSKNRKGKKDSADESERPALLSPSSDPSAAAGGNAFLSTTLGSMARKPRPMRHLSREESVEAEASAAAALQSGQQDGVASLFALAPAAASGETSTARIVPEEEAAAAGLAPVDSSRIESRPATGTHGTPPLEALLASPPPMSLQPPKAPVLDGSKSSTPKSPGGSGSPVPKQLRNARPPKAGARAAVDSGIYNDDGSGGDDDDDGDGRRSKAAAGAANLPPGIVFGRDVIGVTTSGSTTDRGTPSNRSKAVLPSAVHGAGAGLTGEAGTEIIPMPAREAGSTALVAAGSSVALAIPATGSSAAGANTGMGGGGSVKDPDRKSDSSGSTSASKALGRLRRALNETNQPLLPGLRMLKYTGLVVTALAVLLGITLAVQTVLTFESYADNVRHTEDGAQRLHTTVNAILGAMELIEAGRGWRPFKNAAEEATTRASIVGNITQFSIVHRTLYKEMQGTPAEATYTTPYISVLQFDTASALASEGQSSILLLNLLQAGQMLATTMNKIASTPLANLTTDTPETKMMKANFMRGGNVLEEIDSAMDAGYSMSVDAEATLRATQTGVFAGMTALLLLVAAGVFLPILLKIEKSKDTIVLRMVELPMPVKRMLLLQSIRRARTLKRNFVSDEDADAEDESEDEIDNVDAAEIMMASAAATAQAANGQAQLQGAGVDSGDEGGPAGGAVVPIANGPNGDIAPLDEKLMEMAMEEDEGATGQGVDWAAVMRMSASGRRLVSFGARRTNSNGSASPSSSNGAKRSTPAGGRRHHRAQVAEQKLYRKSGSSFFFLLLRFLGPLLILEVFFAVIFGTSMVELDAALSLSSVTMAANIRATSSRELIIQLRRHLGTFADRSYVVAKGKALGDSMQNLRYHQSLLTSGPPATRSRGVYASFIPSKPTVESGTSPLLSDSDNAQILAAMFGTETASLLSTSPSSSSGAVLSPCQYAYRITDDLDVNVNGSWKGEEAAFIRRCASFERGLVEQGLESVLQEYLRRLDILADRRLRARSGNDRDRGLLLPQLGYNYTNEVCLTAEQATTASSLTSAGGGVGGLAVSIEEASDPAAFAAADSAYTACVHASGAALGGSDADKLIVLPPPLIPDWAHYKGDFVWNASHTGPTTTDPATHPIPSWWSALTPREQEGVADFSVPEELNSPDMTFLLEADKLYLTPSLLAIANSYAIATKDSISSFIQFIEVFSGAFLAVFCVFMLFVFVPQVKRANTDIITKRAMLLYLPPEVVALTPSIKMLVKEILSSEGDGALAGLGLTGSGGNGKRDDSNSPAGTPHADTHGHSTGSMRIPTQHSVSSFHSVGSQRGGMGAAPPPPSHTVHHIGGNASPAPALVSGRSAGSGLVGRASDSRS